MVSIVSPGCDRTLCRVETSGSRSIYRLPSRVNLSAKSEIILNCYDSDDINNLVTTKPGRHLNWWTGGNVLLGGIIGGGVDLATGAAYELPSEIEVPLICSKSAIEPGPRNGN